MSGNSENPDAIEEFEEERQEVIVSRIPKPRSHRKQTKLDEQLDKLTAIPPKFCYYCIETFDDKTIKEYLAHILQAHSGKLAFPGRIEIRQQNLKAQGCPWEI